MGAGTWRKDAARGSAGQAEAGALVLWSPAPPSLRTTVHRQPEVRAAASVETDPRRQGEGDRARLPPVLTREDPSLEVTLVNFWSS